MEIKKGIKRSIKKFKFYGGIVKDTVAFKVKRRVMKKKFLGKPIETIIVDMDGTIFVGDSGLEAFSVAYPENAEDGTPMGKVVYNILVKNISSGKETIGEAIITGNKFLLDRGFTKQDFLKVLDRVKPGVRVDVIKALKFAKEKLGIQIILATQSSVEFGQMLNSYLKKKFSFSFDDFVGTSVNFNKNDVMTGLREIVTGGNTTINGIAVKNKGESVEELFQSKGRSFDYTKALMISDGYGDIEMTKRMRTVLLAAKEPSKAQKVSEKLKLADYILHDSPGLEKELEEIFSQNRN